VVTDVTELTRKEAVMTQDFPEPNAALPPVAQEFPIAYEVLTRKAEDGATTEALHSVAAAMGVPPAQAAELVRLVDRTESQEDRPLGSRVAQRYIAEAAGTRSRTPWVLLAAACVLADIVGVVVLLEFDRQVGVAILVLSVVPWAFAVRGMK